MSPRKHTGHVSVSVCQRTEKKDTAGDLDFIQAFLPFLLRVFCVETRTFSVHGSFCTG